MKITTFLMSIMVTLLLGSTVLLTACSLMDEPNTGIPIKMKFHIDCKNSSFPFDNLISSYPCKVLGFSRERDCKPFIFLFEANAYINSTGDLKWLGEMRYWPGKTMKFVAYWPANAHMKFDEQGNLISGDCELIGVTEPANHLSENVTLTFMSYNDYSNP